VFLRGGGYQKELGKPSIHKEKDADDRIPKSRGKIAKRKGKRKSIKGGLKTKNKAQAFHVLLHTS